MARFTPDQFAFAASRRHYLNRDDAIDFLKQMDIRMAVGHWSAGDFCDRFAPPGYHSDDPSFRNDFEGQCRRIKAAGVTYEFKIYPNTQHAFHNDTGPRYNQEQALAAWNDVQAWFGRYLRG